MYRESRGSIASPPKKFTIQHILEGIPLNYVLGITTYSAIEKLQLAPNPRRSQGLKSSQETHKGALVLRDVKQRLI